MLPDILGKQSIKDPFAPKKSSHTPLGWFLLEWSFAHELGRQLGLAVELLACVSLNVKELSRDVTCLNLGGGGILSPCMWLGL